MPGALSSSGIFLAVPPFSAASSTKETGFPNSKLDALGEIALVIVSIYLWKLALSPKIMLDRQRFSTSLIIDHIDSTDALPPKASQMHALIDSTDARKRK